MEQLQNKVAVTRFLILQTFLCAVQGKGNEIATPLAIRPCSIHIWKVSENLWSKQMLNQIIQSNKLISIFTIEVSLNSTTLGLIKFNPNSQEICASNILISSRGATKAILKSICYSGYINFRPVFSLIAIISKTPILFSEIKTYVRDYYQNLYILHTNSINLLNSKVKSVYCDDNKNQRKFLANLVYKKDSFQWNSCLVSYTYLILYVKSSFYSSWIKSPKCLPAREILSQISIIEVVMCDFEHKMFRHAGKFVNITTSLPSNRSNDRLITRNIVDFPKT